MAYPTRSKSYPQSLSQITTRALTNNNDDDFLADKSIFAGQSIARHIQPEIDRFHIGLDLSNPASVRLTATELIIYTKNIAQAAKLKQIQPRLENAVREAGYDRRIVFRLNTASGTVHYRTNLAQGSPRTISSSNLLMIEAAAEKMPESETKKALEHLAQTLLSLNR